MSVHPDILRVTRLIQDCIIHSEAHWPSTYHHAEVRGRMAEQGCADLSRSDVARLVSRGDVSRLLGQDESDVVAVTAAWHVISNAPPASVAYLCEMAAKLGVSGVSSILRGMEDMVRLHTKNLAQRWQKEHAPKAHVAEQPE